MSQAYRNYTLSKNENQVGTIKLLICDRMPNEAKTGEPIHKYGFKIELRNRHNQEHTASILSEIDALEEAFKVIFPQLITTKEFNITSGNMITYYVTTANDENIRKESEANPKDFARTMRSIMKNDKPFKTIEFSGITFQVQ